MKNSPVAVLTRFCPPAKFKIGINGRFLRQIVFDEIVEPDEPMSGLTTSLSAFSDTGIASGEEDDVTPELFVELLAHFYRLGWLHGSSGGMACCSRSAVLYSPSSVQKERLRPADLFVFNVDDSQLVSRPADASIRESACTPVFSLILNNTGALCTIHTHSKYSNLLTQLLADRDRLELSDQEMIKGVLNRRTGHNYANFERLIVPIIENCPQEFQLIPALKQVFEDYPETCGVLVRNHGFFVWGPTWQRTKIMLECYEYLFELACEMMRHNLPLLKTFVV